MKTILEQITERKDVSVAIFKGTQYAYGNVPTWGITLECKLDNIELKIIERDNDLVALIERVWTKFQSLASRGIPQMAAPMIEHKPVPVKPTRLPIDDEIPF